MEEPELSVEEKLITRHKQEKKHLQSEVLQIRHASKNDKKKKKEATVRIAQLEAELEQRQAKEKEELEKSKSEVNGVTEGINDLSTEDASISQQDGSGNTSAKGQKQSKAQKRREKKAQAEREREELIRAAEIDNLQGARHLETQAIKHALRDRGLAVYEIPSDGNCLYAAINHQVGNHNQKYSFNEMRKLTADHMRGNKDNFLPFLSNQDSGEPFTEEEFQDYCDKLESTSEWGGHLEIQALSNVLRRPIEVVQGTSPSILTGEEHQQEKIVLTYHRHAFGLGEHYNSTQPLSTADEDVDHG